MVCTGYLSDKVVAVMKETGNDLPSLYKETSEGGLAKIINRCSSQRQKHVQLTQNKIESFS